MDYLQTTSIIFLIIISIIIIIISIFIKLLTHIYFNKYLKVDNRKSIKSYEFLTYILEYTGLNGIKIQGSSLNSNFNQNENIIYLSSEIFSSSSISAVAIACHKIGYALQYKDNYKLAKLRNYINSICAFVPKLLWLFICISICAIFLKADSMIYMISILCTSVFFIISVILTIFVLPIEIDACKFALNILKKSEILDSNEMKKAKKILNIMTINSIFKFIKIPFTI